MNTIEEICPAGRRAAGAQGQFPAGIDGTNPAGRKDVREQAGIWHPRAVPQVVIGCRMPRFET